MKRYLLPILIFSGITLIGLTLFKVSGSYKEEDLRMRGVSWVGGDSVTIENFSSLRENNVEWIIQTPFGWMNSFDDPTVHRADGKGYYWGEGDAGIEHTNQLSKELGIKTILKPHIWMNPRKGKWRADIKMQSDSAWDQWFDSYELFMMHYARLAETNQMEGLCIGTELYYPSTHKPQKFRELIKKIRSVYSGKLIYAANWHKEYQEIEFWDELDWIGIQAYFPLSDSTNPDLDELIRNWEPIKKELKELAIRYDKPIVFTEVGYRSMTDAAVEPWLWPKRDLNENISYETQALCYEALFNSVWDQEWFGGTFIWKWYPHDQRLRNKNNGFTPQHKPAESVMRDWYQRSSSRSSMRIAD